ncbi:hypothetical protein RF11_02635 [Thelohanellus kitauei]|uniref:Uncharacterized protein n=1 Tax=Thelohanellus kitauei TaxID=669202 RepID=A0A0C2NEK6_THEKT|nr:hypothetical protein RF11_02635 [Thelohanellus kitauei]
MPSSIVERHYQYILPLILNNMDTLLQQYEGQFNLTEQEELDSVANDRKPMFKHSELNLDAFWILIEHGYPAISQKALRFCVWRIKTVKNKKKEQLLPLENELWVCRTRTHPRIPLLKQTHKE